MMKEIVIKIPDELYVVITNPKKLETMYHAGRVCQAICKGKVLPKGHGELRDTKAILDKFDDTYNSKVGLIPDNLAEGFAQCEKLIKTATILVGADKGEE